MAKRYKFIMLFLTTTSTFCMESLQDFIVHLKQKVAAQQAKVNTLAPNDPKRAEALDFLGTLKYQLKRYEISFQTEQRFASLPENDPEKIYNDIRLHKIPNKLRESGGEITDEIARLIQQQMAIQLSSVPADLDYQEVLRATLNSNLLSPYQQPTLEALARIEQDPTKNALIQKIIAKK